MKKFLLSMAVAAFALTTNAQAPLYATGDFDGWNPGEPTEFTFDGTSYTLTVANSSMFKVSTAKGSWDEFNGGALTASPQPSANDETVALVPSEDNIMMPWTGDWTITVSADLATAKFYTTTPKPSGYEKIWVRGGMNGWGTEDAWEMATTDGVVYTIDNVIVEPGVEFKIADAGWSHINYGLPSGNGVMVLGEPVELVFNAQNITLDYEGGEVNPVSFVFNLNDHTLVIDYSSAGISSVSTDNNAPVYYNIQGVRVDNPRNGLYIMQQGSKVSKVIR